MKIHIIAVGKRLPTWINAGFEEYAKRMPPSCQLNLIEISLAPRSKNADIARLIRYEGEQMMSAIPPDNKIITLDVKGQLWDTPKLSHHLQQWREQSRDVSLLIGGPDGLATICLERAEMSWSLSPLTLPHALVRIVVAEQLYRAWSILAGHPYHR